MWAEGRCGIIAVLYGMYTHTQLTKGQQEAITHGQHKRVPSLVLMVEQRVHTIAQEQGEEKP